MPVFGNPDESEYSVTIKADKVFTDTQNTPEYQVDDSSAIYRMLLKNLKPLDFSYYLRRYIYTSADYRKSFDDVSPDEYITTVTDAFTNSGVPGSLKPTSTRPRAAVRN